MALGTLSAGGPDGHSQNTRQPPKKSSEVAGSAGAAIGDPLRPVPHLAGTRAALGAPPARPGSPLTRAVTGSRRSSGSAPPAWPWLSRPPGLQKLPAKLPVPSLQARAGAQSAAAGTRVLPGAAAGLPPPCAPLRRSARTGGAAALSSPPQSLCLDLWPSGSPHLSPTPPSGSPGPVLGICAHS